jgi:GrpB-like predicted nucleotidyltransferase (UPF0157 family)
MVELRPGRDFTDRARAILRHERHRLSTLLGDDHELELLGGSSIPDALTKGDVDLHLRVPPAAFDRTVAALRGVYQVVHPEIWQSTLATFEVAAALPTGIAVTPVGSEHDLRFRLSWAALAADPGLVRAYNEMKLRHRDDPAEYESRKSAFFSALVATSSRGREQPPGPGPGRRGQ